jgi:hypothetical protein
LGWVLGIYGGDGPFADKLFCQSVAYFIQWVIVGAAIGLIYKPS